MPRKTEKKAPQAEQEQDELPAQNEAGPTQREAIILHPGSSYLYVGFASDSAPQAIPHLIAYHQSGPRDPQQTNDAENPSLVLEYKTEITDELKSQREEGLEAVRRALKDYRRSLDVAGRDVDTAEYTEFNQRQGPAERESSELSLTDLSGNPTFVIGSEVLYLPPDSGYQVYKPIRNGRLHIPPSHSLSSVLSMLEDLWTHAIEDYLDLPRKEFKSCQVVLLVPDAIDRQLLKEMMNVVFRMEFAAAILHQESVCATYSAGLSSACVVDVGDEVTHICCVEDGMSNPNTRVILNYGGSDITRLFYWLVNQSGFPYRECRRDSCLDGVLLQQLKESICHMDATQHGVHDYQFSVMSKTPGKIAGLRHKAVGRGPLGSHGRLLSFVLLSP
ncbi:Actin-related protein 8 [Geodia barretti]|uniref:Actin-related protein 8 n=1 Tax=Geodia barretti TaxID=519541 RepID=A0AA35WAP0_GEOBA|nr:Actin-related protein 8 [Geodia barretti]